jgi:hypothetical protein
MSKTLWFPCWSQTVLSKRRRLKNQSSVETMVPVAKSQKISAYRWNKIRSLLPKSALPGGRQ